MRSVGFFGRKPNASKNTELLEVKKFTALNFTFHLLAFQAATFPVSHRVIFQEKTTTITVKMSQQYAEMKLDHDVS